MITQAFFGNCCIHGNLASYNLLYLFYIHNFCKLQNICYIQQISFILFFLCFFLLKALLFQQYLIVFFDQDNIRMFIFYNHNCSMSILRKFCTDIKILYSFFKITCTELCFKKFCCPNTFSFCNSFQYFQFPFCLTTNHSKNCSSFNAPHSS